MSTPAGSCCEAAQRRRTSSMAIILGTSADDKIVGSGGNDTLRGLDGNDGLQGGGGADILDGGNGIDTASYTGSAAGVMVSLQTGAGSGGDATGDHLISIENLTGSAYADYLWADSGVNVVHGRDGNDGIWGYGG